MQYNEKLCDERHATIEKRLDELHGISKELRKVSWGVLVILVLSLVIGLIKGEPDMTAKLIVRVLSIIQGIG